MTFAAHWLWRHALMAIATLAVLGVVGIALQRGWAEAWSTGDQRGRWLLERGHSAEAAATFRDPMWRGVALIRAGDFKSAAQAFGGLDTAAAAYDQGNALVMLGQYDQAIARYDRALALSPGWPDAAANRELARIRAERMRAPGADSGDQREGADQIVYDKSGKDKGGQDTEAAGGEMSDAAVRALWLKRVQTRPGDFLRARFNAQLQQQPGPAETRP